MISYIKPGNKIIISNIKNSRADSAQGSAPEDDGTEYVSLVGEVVSKDIVVASVPIFQGKFVRLPQRANFVFTFHTPRGIVRFKCKVDSYFQEGSNFFMRVKTLGEGELLQRREFFRFPCHLPMKFNVLPEGGDEGEDAEAEAFKGFAGDVYGLVRDLSGGGLCFLSDESIPNGAKIKCVLDLGAEALVVVGKILRKDESRDANLKYLYRVIFVGILDSDKERIIKYIFNEQRHQLKSIR